MDATASATIVLNYLKTRGSYGLVYINWVVMMKIMVVMVGVAINARCCCSMFTTVQSSTRCIVLRQIFGRHSQHVITSGRCIGASCGTDALRSTLLMLGLGQVAGGDRRVSVDARLYEGVFFAAGDDRLV